MKNEQQTTQEALKKTITITELTTRTGAKKFVANVNDPAPTYEAHKSAEALARDYNKATTLGYEIKILTQTKLPL